MLDVICLDSKGEVVTHFYQWDVNQKLVIRDHDLNIQDGEIIEFHFSNKMREKSIPVEGVVDDATGDICVNIPNVLLQEPHKIYCHMYYSSPFAETTENLDDITGRTIARIEIPVRPKAQPEGTYYVEDINGEKTKELEAMLKEEVKTVISSYVDEETGLLVEVYDALDSTSKNVALSANQGKILNDTKANKVDVTEQFENKADINLENITDEIFLGKIITSKYNGVRYEEKYESEVDSLIGEYDDEKGYRTPKLYRIINNSDESDLGVSVGGSLSSRFNEYYIYGMTINSEGLATGSSSHVQYKISKDGIYKRTGSIILGSSSWGDWYTYVTNGVTNTLNTKLERLQYYGDMNIVPTDESYFDITEDGVISFNDYTKEDINMGLITINELIIPYRVNNITVKSIANSAFENYIFTKIIFPNSITSINNFAFFNSIELNSIVIPKSVTHIGEMAFSGCEYLKTAAIPSEIITIGNEAFAGCSEDLTIICNQGSYADTYAQEHGIKVIYDIVDIESLPSGTLDGNVLNYKGSVDYYQDLPVEAITGDTYTIKYDSSDGSESGFSEKYYLKEESFTYESFGIEYIHLELSINQRTKDYLKTKEDIIVNIFIEVFDGLGKTLKKCGYINLPKKAMTEIGWVINKITGNLTLILPASVIGRDYTFIYEGDGEVEDNDFEALKNIIVNDYNPNTYDGTILASQYSIDGDMQRGYDSNYHIASAGDLATKIDDGWTLLPINTNVYTKEQIDSKKANIDLSNIDDETFKAKAEQAGVGSNVEVPTKVSELENDAGYLTEHQDISGKADKATTLAGYGITDAYTKDETDSLIGDIETALDNKADKPTLLTSATETLILTHNQEAHLGEITALTISMPDTIDDLYWSNFCFTSGTTATNLSYPDTIIWVGDDCDSEGYFVPESNASYEVSVKRLGNRTITETVTADDGTETTTETVIPNLVARVGAYA